MNARLIALAHGRSGDKGDLVNIGVIARREEWYPFLLEKLSTERVGEWLQPLGVGPVERYELSNLGALNFLVRRALGGGGSVNLRLDAQGKTFAQALLRLPVTVDDDMVESLQAHWGGELPGYCFPGDEGSSGSTMPSPKRRG